MILIMNLYDFTMYQFTAAEDLLLHLIDIKATKLLALVLSQARGILLHKTHKQMPSWKLFAIIIKQW